MKIIVKRRFADFHACLAEKPVCWAAGKSIDEAIGDLVRCHPEMLGVQIEYVSGPHGSFGEMPAEDTPMTYLRDQALRERDIKKRGEVK